jgi:catechol 2,3-dioxygenase-like lactoylglutathione lyase family enzyme
VGLISDARAAEVLSGSPWSKQGLGVHHIAQPTLEPEASLAFYKDTLGVRIASSTSTKGLRNRHHDFVEIHLDVGNGAAITLSYYFGAQDPAKWPVYGTHTALRAADVAELDRLQEWLESRECKVFWRAEAESMTTIYFRDPDKRWLAISADHRPLDVVDAEDAELTAEALVLACRDGADAIERMWEYKARLVAEREGEIAAPAVLYPKLAGFALLVEGAGSSERRRYDRGSYTVVEGDGSLRVRRPEGLPDGVWLGVAHGGVVGAVERFDEQELVVTREGGDAHGN